jgi:hypothetical protein
MSNILTAAADDAAACFKFAQKQSNFAKLNIIEFSDGICVAATLDPAISNDDSSWEAAPHLTTYYRDPKATIAIILVSVLSGVAALVVILFIIVVVLVVVKKKRRAAAAALSDESTSGFVMSSMSDSLLATPASGPSSIGEIDGMYVPGAAAVVLESATPSSSLYPQSLSPPAIDAAALAKLLDEV